MQIPGKERASSGNYYNFPRKWNYYPNLSLSLSLCCTSAKLNICMRKFLASYVITPSCMMMAAVVVNPFFPFSLLSLNDFHFHPAMVQRREWKFDFISEIWGGREATSTTIQPSTRKDDNNKMRLSHYTHFSPPRHITHSRCDDDKGKKWKFANENRVVNKFLFYEKREKLFSFINARILKIPHISSLSLTL